MLRVVLNAWVTKTTAAEILANPATRRRQVTMTISLNPLRFGDGAGTAALAPAELVGVAQPGRARVSEELLCGGSGGAFVNASVESRMSLWM